MRDAEHFAKLAFKLNDTETLKAFGISRVGSLTGLDRIGIPVWFTSRPNSFSLSLSQGKGLCDEIARVSAIMEAIEMATCEDALKIISKFASMQEMISAGCRIVPFERLSRCNSASIDLARSRGWVRGIELRTQKEIYAPYELVGLDMRVESPMDHNAYRMSSNGLGAAFDFNTALEHALLELVEADAAMLTDIFGLESEQFQPLVYKQGINPELDSAMLRILASGAEVRLFKLFGKTAIPVVLATIVGMTFKGERSIKQFTGGTAARLDLGEAILAAVLEAAQSRVTRISGARDDLSEWSRSENCVREQAKISTLKPLCMSTQVSNLYTAGSPVWETIAQCIYAAGVEEIFIFRLPTKLDEVVVVRVLIPGLGIATEGMSFLTVQDLIQPQADHA